MSFLENVRFYSDVYGTGKMVQRCQEIQVVGCAIAYYHCDVNITVVMRVPINP